MKTHTNDYKNQIKQFGKEIDSKITYELDGQTIELGKEMLNSVTPHYEASILKSVMKQLDIDSNVEIPIETEINYQFGLKINNSYEYINYGNYIVYSSEKQEDTNSWKIVCYDKMLYAMKPYETLNIIYPINIKNYLKAICNKIGLTFKESDFANQDREILNELYLDTEGNSLDYTYRDVLDEIAQATGSIICINEETDELEVRYMNDTGERETTTGTILKILDLEDNYNTTYNMLGDTSQDGTPTPTTPKEVNTVTGRQTISVCGKNIININGIYSSSGSSFIRTYENGIATLTWTSGFNFYMTQDNSQNQPLNILDSSETYTISFYHKGNAVNLRFDESSTNLVATANDNDYTRYSYTFTGLNSLVVKFVRRDNSGTAYLKDFQIEKGNQATTYEAYDGNNYEINLGKNLFNKDDSNLIFNGFPNGSTNKLQSNANAKTIFIPCQPNKKYTISKTISARFVIADTSSDSIVADINVTMLATTANVASHTITTSANARYLLVFYYLSTADTLSEETIRNNIQIEVGSTATSYAPYFTPIELCKINNYQDFIRKGTGKNLFEGISFTKTSHNITFTYNTDGSIDVSNGTTDGNALSMTSTEARNNNFLITLEPDTYTISGNVGDVAVEIVDSNGTAICNTRTTNTFTLNEEKQVFLRINILSGKGVNPISVLPMIVKGTNAGEYEPYGYKDKWYIYKDIGKDILNGSETWSYGNNIFSHAYSLQRYIGSTITTFSNYFQGGYNKTSASNFNNGNNDNTIGFTQTHMLVKDNSITSASNFKTWLTNNNLTVYFISRKPTYTEITNTELISQLNSIRFKEGLNNILITSPNISTPLQLTYTTNTDTIDEEYLKDININFGEKYGPVNSIVLSRASESDNVYIQDEQSVEDNGLCELKIKDNQIMNFNDRSDYLPELLEKLDNLQFYINDFVSPGITYYDLCDKYNVKIGDNKYKCIMFNDEVLVTQGLEENIHTDMPEETETDYQYASKTDRTINKAYIIVKKNEAEIEALAEKVVDLSSSISGIDSITLDNAYEGILHRLEITGNINLLYPSDTLYPSETLYPIDTNLMVDENKFHLDIDYLVYTNSDNHDTFIYEDGKCWIERADGTIEDKESVDIIVSKNSVITMEQFNNIIFKCDYLLDNQYTSTFANQVTVSSELNLLADSLEAKVSQVADEDGNVTSSSIILAVNNDESLAEIKADKINLNGVVTANENFRILEDGSMETKNGTFNGTINGGVISVSGEFTEQSPYIEVIHPNSTQASPIGTTIWSDGISCYNYGGGLPVIRTETGSGFAELSGSVVNAYGFNNISLEEKKKNFEKFDNALNVINDIDIYKYNYKNEDDEGKKHIGLVIGNNYKYSKEVTSNDNTEVDIYSFVSVCCKAIQELQKEIEDLKKEMK